MHPSVIRCFTISLTMTILSRAVAAAFTPRAGTAFQRAATRAAPSSTVRFLASDSAKPPMPYDDDKMVWYALGTNLAVQVGGQSSFKTLLDEEELEVVLEAFADNLRGTSLVDPRTVLGTYGPRLNQLLQERSNFLIDRVKQEGADFIKNFLDCNEEAVATESGLVYYEMKKGDGKSPSLTSTVEVHYHGTLTDGTVFDSSVDRGQTISFPLNGVIQGWQEGLQLMKEGGKATLVVPSDLAYGDGGSGEVIPPGATLKFEVELFKVSN